MWRKIQVRNWRWRSGMIYCRGVIEGENLGWSVAEVMLCGVEVSGMGKAPEWLRVSELHGWKRSRGEGQLLEWLWSDGDSWLQGHMSSMCESQILTTTDALRSSLCRSLRKISRESEVGERFLSASNSSWYSWAEENMDSWRRFGFSSSIYK